MNRFFVSDSDERVPGALHPPDDVIQSLVEGTLRREERTRVATHVHSCSRCTAELEGYRMVIVGLSELPRFAPSADFGDAVMARVKVAPEPNAVVARVLNWLPRTRAGWSWFVLALLFPIAALAGVGVWLSSQFVVSPSLTLSWTLTRLRSDIAAAAMRGADWIGERELWAVAERGAAALAALPPGLLAIAAVFFAVAIPASGWLLVRLLQTPMGDRSHA